MGFRLVVASGGHSVVAVAVRKLLIVLASLVNRGL